jgi:hypothetical protein
MRLCYSSYTFVIAKKKRDETLLFVLYFVQSSGTSLALRFYGRLTSELWSVAGAPRTGIDISRQKINAFDHFLFFCDKIDHGHKVAAIHSVCILDLKLETPEITT